MVQYQRRFFAPPKPAGGKPGGPLAAPAAPAVIMQRTPFEKMADEGKEFLFGAPPGINKVVGAHRDTAIPKLEGRMEHFAKRLRDFYIREGTIPDAKIYVDTLRVRQPEDTIEKCVANKECAGKSPCYFNIAYSCHSIKRGIP